MTKDSKRNLSLPQKIDEEALLLLNQKLDAAYSLTQIESLCGDQPNGKTEEDTTYSFNLFSSESPHQINLSQVEDISYPVIRYYEVTEEEERMKQAQFKTIAMTYQQIKDSCIFTPNTKRMITVPYESKSKLKATKKKRAAANKPSQKKRRIMRLVRDGKIPLKSTNSRLSQKSNKRFGKRFG